MLQKSIWTSVIDALWPPTFPGNSPNAMISKELTNTTKKKLAELNRIPMAGKVHCKVCHRRLRPSFDVNSCKRGDCPLDKGPKDEILDFKDWPKNKFTVIQDLECEDAWTNNNS